MTEEPSHQQIIEAHLHLLLDGKETIVVAVALHNILKQHHPELSVIVLNEAQQTERHLMEANNHLIAANNMLEGRDSQYGKSILDRMKEVHNLLHQTNTAVNYARTRLSQATYRMSTRA